MDRATQRASSETRRPEVWLLPMDSVNSLKAPSLWGITHSSANATDNQCKSFLCVCLFEDNDAANPTTNHRYSSFDQKKRIWNQSECPKLCRMLLPRSLWRFKVTFWSLPILRTATGSQEQVRLQWVHCTLAQSMYVPCTHSPSQAGLSAQPQSPHGANLACLQRSGWWRSWDSEKRVEKEEEE